MMLLACRDHGTLWPQCSLELESVGSIGSNGISDNLNGGFDGNAKGRCPSPVIGDGITKNVTAAVSSSVKRERVVQSLVNSINNISGIRIAVGFDVLRR